MLFLYVVSVPCIIPLSFYLWYCSVLDRNSLFLESHQHFSSWPEGALGPAPSPGYLMMSLRCSSMDPAVVKTKSLGGITAWISCDVGIRISTLYFKELS